MSWRILVTGPRAWDDWRTLSLALLGLAEGRKDVTVVSGCAAGFDYLSMQLARKVGWDVDPFPVSAAEWRPGGIYDPVAGHRRNQVMVDSGADVALAGIMACVKKGCPVRLPHGTHGTADCIRRINRAGMPLRKIRPGGREGSIS